MTHEELTEKCLLELIRHVLAHQNRLLVGITYQNLAHRIGFLNKNGDPHSRLGKVLGKMGHLLEQAQPAFQEAIPHLQALVIAKTGKNQGMPDDGITEFWEDYDRLNRAEKENKAFSEWQKIADFGSRWNMVLEQLQMPAISIPSPATSSQKGQGGESAAHKALKHYIKNNPHVVGVEKSIEAFDEYTLPSLDTLDVLFKAPACWTAVEVKSAISDKVAGDYERGLYQIVKYTALLQAMRHDSKYEVPETIRVVLALESALPVSLRKLKKHLDVEIIENIKFDN